jgi:hypothetical protein
VETLSARSFGYYLEVSASEGLTFHPPFSSGTKAAGCTHSHYPPRVIEPVLQHRDHECIYVHGGSSDNPDRSGDARFADPWPVLLRAVAFFLCRPLGIVRN